MHIYPIASQVPQITASGNKKLHQQKLRIHMQFKNCNPVDKKFIQPTRQIYHPEKKFHCKNSCLAAAQYHCLCYCTRNKLPIMKAKCQFMAKVAAYLNKPLR